MLTSLSTPRSEKGQGLLIVVLFLLFIAMIVIVVSRVVHSDRIQNHLQAESSYYTMNNRDSNDPNDSDRKCDPSMDGFQTTLGGTTDSDCEGILSDIAE